MSTLHVLLPALAACGDAAAWRRWLGQGNRLPDTPAARDGAVRGLLRCPGDALPVAALRHSCHADDAGADAWVCADPAWIRSEATGARLMAWPLADLSASEAAELAATLQPLFGDAGVPLVMDTPTAWCVRVPAGAPAATFTEPARALGAAMLDCLPAGEGGRTWRRLFNEAQIALHEHPCNVARVAAGQHPANALWFWGAGVLPDAVTTELVAVASSDDVVRGLAGIAQVNILDPLPATVNTAAPAGDVLLDVGDVVAGDVVEQWLPEFQRGLRARRFAAIELTFASGERFRVKRAHRLRFWRHA